MTFAWTDDAIAELRRCADAKMSAGEASKHITEHYDFVSRNGVLGKAFRLGVIFASHPAGHGVRKGDKKGRKVEDLRGRRRPPGVMKWGKQASSTPLPPAHVFTGDPTEVPEAQRKSILTLTNESCRWPYGDLGRPGFFFCGAPEADCGAGKPYCSSHSLLAYNTRGAVA